MGISGFVQAFRSTPRDRQLDAAGFADAVRPHLPGMIRLAARLGPRDGDDDVVQEALLRAWRHRARYDPSRGSLAGWLFAIVANEARRAAARQRRPTPVDPQRRAFRSDEEIDVEAALRRLPPRQRMAVDCFYFAGLSITETAEAMGCAEGTVKSTLADARHRLRGELEDRA